MDKNISLDLYKIFCTVVKCKNMSTAAKELYISQPAVSMSISHLEEKLGASLLIRTKKGVHPTPEGNVLYEYLDQGLALIKTAENKYMEMTNLKAGEIKIGASDTVIANLLMPYLEKFNTSFPKINIKVTNKTTYECLRLLRSGAVDICFINLPIEDNRDLEIKPFKSIQDCLLGGSKYKDLVSTGIEWKNIDNYPLLLLENLSNSRQFLNKVALKNGVVLDPIIELGSTDLLLSFAKINLGLTFATREFVSNNIDNENLFEIPLTPAVPKRNIGIVRLKNVTLSHGAKHFSNMFV